MGRRIAPQDLVTANPTLIGAIQRGSRRINFNGTSITDNGQTTLTESGNTAASFDSTGYSQWVRLYLGQNFQSDITDNDGVSGSLSADILARVQARAAAGTLSQYGLAIIDGPTNDAASSPVVTPATTNANLMAIYQLYRAAGVHLVMTTVLPRPPGGWGGTAQDTIDRRNRAHQINRTLKTMAMTLPGFSVVNLTPLFIDYSSATGDGLQAYFYDTGGGATHPNPAGCQLMGKAIADAVRGLFLVFDARFWSISDTWDATYNPAGNQLLNGLLAGTTGTVAGLSTGTTPTSWAAASQGSGSVTSGTLVWSKETAPRSDGGPGDRAILTASSVVGTGTGFNVYLGQSVNINTSKFAAGDILVADMEIELAASQRGLWGMGVRVIESDGTVSLNYRDGKGLDGTRLLPTVAIPPLPFSSPSFTVRPYSGSGTQLITVRAEVNFDSTVASGANFVVKFGAVNLRKVG